MSSQYKNKDKGGRPTIWISPTIPVRVPERYAKALIEIALEWQQNDFLHGKSDK